MAATPIVILAVELAAADRLLLLLVLQRSVGLLAFTFLGTHRSGRLAVRLVSSRAPCEPIAPLNEAEGESRCVGEPGCPLGWTRRCPSSASPPGRHGSPGGSRRGRPSRSASPCSCSRSWCCWCRSCSVQRSGRAGCSSIRRSRRHGRPRWSMSSASCSVLPTWPPSALVVPMTPARLRVRDACLELLDPRSSNVVVGSAVAVTAWALIAVEGIRRMFFVALLVVVLLSGRFPFELPGLADARRPCGGGRGVLDGSLVAVGRGAASGGPAALVDGFRRRRPRRRHVADRPADPVDCDARDDGRAQPRGRRCAG